MVAEETCMWEPSAVETAQCFKTPNNPSELCPAPDTTVPYLPPPQSLSLSESMTPSRRTLMRERTGGHDQKGEDDLVSLYKISILEDQKRRADEHERRLIDREEERSRLHYDRSVREEERGAERVQCQEEGKRQDRFIELIVLYIWGNNLAEVLVLRMGVGSSEDL